MPNFGRFGFGTSETSIFQGRGSSDSRRSTVFKPERSTLHCWRSPNTVAEKPLNLISLLFSGNRSEGK